MPKIKNPKLVTGSKKVPTAAISRLVLFELGLAMHEGDVKHARFNYRDAGGTASAYHDALMRHIGYWWEGEDIDPGSGLSHVTKAIATLVVLRDLMIVGKLVDDRPPPLPPDELKKFREHLDELTVQLNERYPNPRPPHTRTHVGRRRRKCPIEKFYISGRITNEDPEVKQQNLERFNEAARKLRANGKHVFNPAEHEREGWTWEMYMAHFSTWITEHRPTLYMLRGWQDSPGARLEHELAKLLGLKIEYEED